MFALRDLRQALRFEGLQRWSDGSIIVRLEVMQFSGWTLPVEVNERMRRVGYLVYVKKMHTAFREQKMTEVGR